jgi:hypothetical protein
MELCGIFGYGGAYSLRFKTLLADVLEAHGLPRPAGVPGPPDLPAPDPRRGARAAAGRLVAVPAPEGAPSGRAPFFHLPPRPPLPITSPATLRLEALEGREARFGPDDPESLVPVKRLARSLLALGDKGWALELILRARALAMAQEPPGAPPESMALQAEAAALLIPFGLPSDAEGLAAEAAGRLSLILGPAHPSAARAARIRARALEASGGCEEAAEVLRQLMGAVRPPAGRRPPDPALVRDASGDLCRMLLALGRGGEAMAVSRGEHRLLTGALGIRDRLALSSLHDWAARAEAAGLTEEAERRYRDCLSARTECLGPDDPDTLETKAALALLTKGRIPAGPDDGRGDA